MSYINVPEHATVEQRLACVIHRLRVISAAGDSRAEIKKETLEAIGALKGGAR